MQLAKPSSHENGESNIVLIRKFDEHGKNKIKPFRVLSKFAKQMLTESVALLDGTGSTPDKRKPSVVFQKIKKLIIYLFQ